MSVSVSANVFPYMQMHTNTLSLPVCSLTRAHTHKQVQKDKAEQLAQKEKAEAAGLSRRAQSGKSETMAGYAFVCV